MPYITLLHGTNHILKKPAYSLGKSHNDYGRGFIAQKIWKWQGKAAEYWVAWALAQYQ